VHSIIADIRNLISHHLLSVIIIYSGMRVLDLIYSKLYYTIELARKKRFQIKSIKLTNKRYNTVPDIDTTILDIQKQERETNDPTTVNREN